MSKVCMEVVGFVIGVWRRYGLKGEDFGRYAKEFLAAILLDGEEDVCV